MFKETVIGFTLQKEACPFARRIARDREMIMVRSGIPELCLPDALIGVSDRRYDIIGAAKT